jgi:serine/threonine protein kinase
MIEGEPVLFPGLSFVKEAGRGANAVVFEATDQALNRRVAVKVWNARGVKRAQYETAKIAQLSHPLIVATHHFSRIQDHPYAVMEFVAGCSGKEWIEQHPSIAARCLVWRLYSRALRFIHDAGGIHGDPHLGNVLVFLDPDDNYGHRIMWGKKVGLSIKLADTGTSEFWTSRGAILKRESNLIYETAARLFSDQQFAKLWIRPTGFSHEETLQVLDVLCEYIERVNCSELYEHRSQNADILVDVVMKAPLFGLDTIITQIKRTGYTGSDRFARRMNQRLLKISDIMDAGEEISPETLIAYASAREEFLAKNLSKTQCPQPGGI